MPDKLNQSLDQILSERKKNSSRPRRGTRRPGAKPATAAPVGGIKKAVKAVKQVARGIPTGPSNGARDSKIVVSNLPLDVTETQIKEYFAQTIGSVKKVDLSYGLNGKSKGIATVIFSKPEAAAKAAKDLDGLKVDSRPMKIEVILAAKDAPAPPAPKTLGDRITKPKSAAKDKPKPATVTKPEAGAKGGRKGRAAGGRGGRNAGRGKPKSADELDAEMQDYFEKPDAGNGDAAMSNGGAVQPSSGDAGMDDDIVA